MEGPQDVDFLSDEAGILPRTALYIHKEIQRLLKQFKSDIRIKLSAIEIYCENIRELFKDDKNEAQAKMSNLSKSKKKENKENNFFCQDQHWIEVKTEAPQKFIT